MNNYNVVRLINNVTLVGETQFSPEDVVINQPLEVYSKPIHDRTGKVVGEQMVLRPLLVMTGEKEIVLDTYNILFTNKLDDKLIPTYKDMASTVYAGKVSYDGNAYVEEEPTEEYTKEEAEYMKEVLDNFLDKDKTIH